MNMRLVLLLQGFLACLPLVSSADQDVQARFEKSLSEARHLPNFEIEWLDAYTNYENPVLHATTDRPFWRIFQYSYVASGTRYRATSKLISGSQTNLLKVVESAFDGKERFDYDGSTRYMTLEHQDSLPDVAESVYSPVAVVFMFLSKQSDDCPFCLLRFKDITATEAGSIMIPSASLMPGGLLEISMPGLPLGHQPTSWKIILDTNGDSFTPKTIKSMTLGGTNEIVWELLNYTNLEAYRFPSKIVSRMSSYSPTSSPKLVSALA